MVHCAALLQQRRAFIMRMALTAAKLHLAGIAYAKLVFLWGEKSVTISCVTMLLI